MKHLLLTLVLVVVSANTMAQATAEPDLSQASTEEKLAALDAERQALEIKVNHMMWHCYLDKARHENRIIASSKIEGVDYKALCDTVPEIAALRKAYDECYDDWLEIAKSDPEYEDIHKEYISLKGSTDKRAKEDNQARYNIMYDRLARNHPDYLKARDSKNKARFAIDFAVVEYVVDYYISQNRMIPKAKDVYMHLLTPTYPELKSEYTLLNVMHRLYNELQEQRLREKYGISSDTSSRTIEIE